jgi:hypothetical protein
MSIYISSWWSGWSSKLCGLLIRQRRGDRAVGSGGFCLTPVITCLFFVAIVLSMLEIRNRMQHPKVKIKIMLTLMNCGIIYSPRNVCLGFKCYCCLLVIVCSCTNYLCFANK